MSTNKPLHTIVVTGLPTRTKFPRKEISLQCLDEKADEQAQGQDRERAETEVETRKDSVKLKCQLDGV
jgi:hypothetical protein